MQKYPYKLSIVHSIKDIVNPLKAVIISAHAHSSEVLEDIILTAADSQTTGIFLSVLGRGTLIDWFISSDILLKGIVEVIPAKLNEEDLKVFNKCVNTN